MGREVDQLTQEIEATRASLAARADEIEYRVEEGIELAKATAEIVRENVQERLQRLSPTYQARQRPWLMVGGAVLAGVLVGRKMAAPVRVKAVGAKTGSGLFPRFAGMVAIQVAKEMMGPSPLLTGVEKALFQTPAN